MHDFEQVFGPYDPDNDKTITVDFDPNNSIYFCGIDNRTVYEKLAEYYDVTKITSIHSDDCAKIGVWICYK